MDMFNYRDFWMLPIVIYGTLELNDYLVKVIEEEKINERLGRDPYKMSEEEYADFNKDRMNYPM